MSDVFTPVTEADEVYGEGDWRPVLGQGPIQDEWKFFSIGKTSVDKRMQGIILPAHDYTVPVHDASFQTSIAPMWTNTPQKNREKHFTASAWGIPIMIYPYLGDKKEHWLSPRNKSNMIGRDDLSPEDYADAFDDLNKFIRTSNDLTDAQKDSFLKTKSYTEHPKVPGKAVRYVSLTEVKDKDNQTRQKAVILYTTSAHAYLIEQCRWPHDADDGPPRDPNYPKYLLGDVTNPGAAVVWGMDRRVLSVGKDQKEINVLCFTNRPEFLDANQETWKVSQEVLDSRFVLADPKNWNIPTYESQVEFMVNHYHQDVTIEMIQAACGHRCNTEIPSSRPERVHLTTDEGGSDTAENTQRSEADREAEYRQQQSAEGRPSGNSFAPTGAAPEIPQAAAEQAQAPVSTAQDATTYKAGRPKQQPELLTATQLQALVDKGEHEGMKVMVAPGDWKNIEDSGLVTIPTAVPEETIPDNDLIPDDTVPDEVPEEVPATAVEASAPDAGGQCTLEEMHTRIFPDREAFAQLSAEKQELANSIVEEGWKATNHGADEELPAHIINRMMDEVLTD